jgi:two-component system, sensor histidine kinase YesM
MNRKFFTKIFLSICIVSFTGIFGLAYYYQEYYRNILIKNEMDSVKRSINQANLNLDNQIKRIVNDLNYFFYYAHNGADYFDSQNRLEVQSTLESFRLQYSDQVESAFFMIKEHNANGKETLIYDQSLDLINRIDYQTHNWYKNFIQKKSSLWVKPTTDHLFYQDRSLNTIYLTLTQFDIQGHDVIFVVRLNGKLFSDYYRLLASSDVSIELNDDDGNVIYTSIPSGTEDNEERYIKMDFVLNYSHFQVKTLIDEQSIKAQVSKNLLFNRNFIVLLILITLGISILLSMTLVLPIKKLVLLMEKVETGDMGVRFESKYKDEIGVLGRNFNKMIANLSALIDKVYVAKMEKVQMEIRQKEAKILALQNQINPHFLYNTLEVINCQAIINEVPDISRMTSALADFFRYPVENNTIEVKVQMEIQYVNTYLEIQRERYPDIEIIIDNLESFFDLPIVKLTLQPIVENAYKHAFSEERDFFLQISGERFNDHYTIHIEDNGVGMDEEKIQQINQLFDMDYQSYSQNDSDGRSGLGLLNVHQRIRLRYGVPFGLSVCESMYGGVLVSIRLPLEGEKL